jgi:integrase
MAGQLIKRGERRWMVRIFLGREAGTGKKLFHSKTIHGGKKDAERYLHACLRERDLGKLARPQRMSVNTFLDQWLNASEERLEATTFRGYENNLRLYVRPYLGALRLDELTPVAVQGLYTRLTQQGLSPRTVQYVHTIFSGALKQAVLWQMLPANPASSTMRPKGKRQVQIQILDRDQVPRFMAACQDHPRGLIFELALATGMRPEEYLGLTWPCVDWRAGQVRIEQVLVRLRAPTGDPRRPKQAWALKDTKTKESRRSIDVPAPLLARLKEHQKTQIERQAQAGSRYAKHHLVFADDFGEPAPTLQALTKGLHKLLADAGLSRMRLYDLRHTCATLLLADGENVKVVTERLGHSSVKITLDTYTQVLPNMQAQASRRMDSMLYGAPVAGRAVVEEA